MDRHLEDPELLAIEGSEIEAVVDITSFDLDKVSRPICICQDAEFIYLTINDAKRLQDFLSKAIPFVDEYNLRTTQ